MTTNVRTYSELITIPTFEERFRYLQLNGSVGAETFGYERYLNQRFYRSEIWKRIRDKVIIRDAGFDMGLEEYPIGGKIYVHHMNPLTKDDLVNLTDYLTNPEFLICVSYDTHNALHYGDTNFVKSKEIITRTKNDTCPWKN